MLDVFIIEEIKRRERQREEREQPRIELPLPPQTETPPKPKDKGGVVIEIQLAPTDDASRRSHLRA